MQRHGIPGLAVAVAREGKLVKAEGYGLANVELGVPASAETVFEIGSITKQFTAALVLMLAAENKLCLADKIGEFFEGTPETWQDITLRHLLNHTSGLTNYTSLGGFEVTRKLNASRFIRALAPHPLVFPPGAAWSYCNSGYNLLGYVIEKATGKSYWENLRGRTLLPLGMTTSQGRDPGTVITNRADGYELVNGKLTNRDSDLTDVFAAGALVSTVLDLVKWNSALDAGKLLPPELQEQMWTPARLNNGQTYPYGFGWRLDNYKQWQCVSHSGSTAGFSASVQRYPQERLAVIVLCNLGKQNVATQAGRGVAELVIRPQVETQTGR
jgi:CubicO group peptidase (beta-lactamase class C family)